MKQLNPVFVEFIPKELEEGVLYISIRFRTAVHKCACGCGNKTVTRFSPTDWKLIFNGKTVSLFPSIGNWGFPCQSHYWIRENNVEWAEQWYNEMAETSSQQDKVNKLRYLIKKKNHNEKKEQQLSRKRWWLYRLIFRNIK